MKDKIYYVARVVTFCGSLSRAGMGCDEVWWDRMGYDGVYSVCEKEGTGKGKWFILLTP